MVERAANTRGSVRRTAREQLRHIKKGVVTLAPGLIVYMLEGRGIPGYYLVFQIYHHLATVGGLVG